MQPAKRSKPDPLYFGDGEFSDLTLVVDDQDFHVHRMFLIARSDIFKEMLYDESTGVMKENNRVEIKDISPKVFKKFLEIIYIGKALNPFSFLIFNICDRKKQHTKLPDRPYKEIFRQFWTVCSELLKIADRFNMDEIVRDYLEDVIRYNIDRCTLEDCHKCFNYFMFSLIHGLDLSSCLHPKEMYSSDDGWENPEGGRNKKKYAAFKKDYDPKVAFGGLKPGPIYFGSKSLSDLTLVVDNQELNVHRMTLASRSDVFEAMLYGPFKEGNENRIEIKDVDPETFIRFIEFFYTSKIIDPKKFFFSTNNNNHYFELPRERNRYITFFSKFWTVTTELLKIADRFNMTPEIKYNLESALNLEILQCSNKTHSLECHKCFNIYFFCVVHELNLPSCQVPFAKRTYRMWFEHMPENNEMGSVSDEEWAKFEDVMNDTKKSIDENENAEKVVSDEVEPSGPISFGSKYLSDLTLVVDNQELNVHRMYLAARSDVFGAMLYGEFKESKEDRIEIKEVDLQAFIRFLQIIYTGKIDDPKEFFFSKDYHGHSESVNAYSPFRKSAYTTIFSKFWAAGAELLKIADRFNMTSFVKKFDCYSCFNLFMFSLVHSVDLASQKDFSREVYNYWVAHCKRAIPETVPLAVISHLINKEWQ